MKRAKHLFTSGIVGSHMMRAMAGLACLSALPAWAAISVGGQVRAAVRAAWHRECRDAVAAAAQRRGRGPYRGRELLKRSRNSHAITPIRQFYYIRDRQGRD
jgi:hypothetical protein